MALRELIFVAESNSHCPLVLSKESRPREPGFGLPPGRGLSMSLLYSTYLWSTPSLLETVTGRADHL
jgi:hypothetical protein